MLSEPDPGSSSVSFHQYLLTSTQQSFYVSSSSRPAGTISPRAVRPRLGFIDGLDDSGRRSRLSRSPSEDSLSNPTTYTTRNSPADREEAVTRRIHRLRRVRSRLRPASTVASATSHHSPLPSLPFPTTSPRYRYNPTTPPYAPSSPDPIGLDYIQDLPRPRSSSQPASPTPRHVHGRNGYRRSQSPSHSPSRTGHVSLGVPPLSVAEPLPAALSPPHSPSLAWLEEYSQHRAVTSGRPAGSGMSYERSGPVYSHHQPLWTVNALEGDLRPLRRQSREEDDEEEERPSTRRRYGSNQEDHDQTPGGRDGPQSRLLVPPRDTRRDGIVIEPVSPAPGSGGLFGSDSHLLRTDAADLPSRRNTLSQRNVAMAAHRDTIGRPTPRDMDFWSTDTWEEVGEGESLSYRYII